MPDINDEKPDFDELDRTGDMPEETEPDKLDLPGDELLQPDEATEDEKSETEKETKDQETGELEAEEEPEEKNKQELYVEAAVIATVCVGILAGTFYGAASEGLFYCSMLSIYLLAISAIPYVLWKSHETNTLYRVLLAITLAAILTAIMCMLSELKRYDYDVKAEGAQSISAVIATSHATSRTKPHCVYRPLL